MVRGCLTAVACWLPCGDPATSPRSNSLATLLPSLRIIGFTLWGAGLWALAIVAVEHGNALSLGTSLRKFRILQRTLFRQLVATGALLYFAAEAATQLYLPDASLRPTHGLLAIAVAAVTIFADRAITTLAQDPSQGHATHRLAMVRSAGMPVFIGGLLLELWPFL